MTSSQLLALELGAAVVGAGSWVGAAVLAALAPSRRSARFAVALVGVGVVALLAQAGLSGVLVSRHWAFAQERLLFALPLAALGAAIAVIFGLRPLLAAARGWPDRLSAAVPTGMTAAAIAGILGIVARSVIGYPLTLPAAAVLLALAVLTTALAAALFARRGRRQIAGLVAFSALVACTGVGYAWLTDTADPSSLTTPHQHPSNARPALASADAVSVEELRTPPDADGPVASFDLTAGTERLTLASGASVDAWAFGSVPGPELRVTEGDLVKVTLHNADIAEGVTIHWHGVDLPNGDDGVAGVTQNAVRPGDSFQYRFVAEDPGTYWYHTHQHSAEGVKRGLYGTLVVLPKSGIAEQVDLTLPVHTLGRRVLLGETDEGRTVRVEAGQSVRLRLLNTDQVPRRFRIAGTDFRVVAADARDLTAPTPVESAALRIPAGGRLDIAFTMPDTGVLVTTDASSSASLTLTAGEGAATPQVDPDAPDLDLLHYGRHAGTPAVPDGPLIESTMVLDRLPRFLSGIPREAYTVNGRVFPHIPSLDVREGDTVRLTVVNRGWETHPMHIHGHHVLVLSRNGVAATGSPLRLDTFDVQPGEVWEVLLSADNPGIWMDHCHNLDHAVEGMMMALRYEGVTSPFEQGGPHDNHPE
ncbi:multicopper oxidase family protein [Lysobacter korlensis]|uniref:Multicopper oxidase family protein n=1 Tax=Lysobacter korlensis TaxID=553636 RepID=A0ABV6RW10_9GAMM